MAVPGSGELEMGSLAVEKLYDNYNSTGVISGQVSMYDLVNGGNTNGSGNSYDATNTNSLAHPDTVVPHAFSEWYSYDHDATALYQASWSPSGTVSSDSANGTDALGHASLSAACSSTGTITNCITMNWNGTLGNGTVLYYNYNSCNQDTVMDANNRWIKIGSYGGGLAGCGTDATSTYTDYVMQVSDSGVVSNFQQCVTLTAYTSSQVGVFNATCPINGSVNTLNQTYYHDGSGTYPTAGDTCYSDSAGNNPLAAGYYVLGNSTSGTGNRNYIFIDSSDGVVEFGYPQSC
jgi:hypothetical protein